MPTELIHVGFGNVLSANRIIAVVCPDSAPTKRLVQDARKNGKLIDMTNGRRTKAVLVIDSGHIALAAIIPDTLASRMSAGRGST